MRATMVWSAVFAVSTISSTRAAEPVGAWQGTLKVVPGVELRLVLNVSKSGDGLKATFDSPDQGSVGQLVDAISVDGGKLVFANKAIKGEYQGMINESGTEFVGTWTQGGKPFPLTLTKTDKPLKLAIPAELVGYWEGTINAGGGIELRLGLRVAKKPDGSATVAFSSPDQGANVLPINAISLDGDKVTAESKRIAAKFVGTLNAAKTEIAGTWSQPGASLPLTLKKMDKPTESKRTQMPKPPFPYRVEDVSYPNKAAGIRLAGALTMPQGQGPFPVALMITGSGAQDRDETLLGHKPFLVIADALTRRGIAVLRIDDRGVGQSTGSQETATSQDFAGDVLAGVAYLKTRKDVDPKAIGLIGHSEGGLIAPMVAAKSADVGFIVLMAGPGTDGMTIVKAQSRLILKAMGVPEKTVDARSAASDRLFDIIRTERDPEIAAKAVKKASEDAIAALPEAERKALGELAGGAADSQIKRLNTPWFRFFLTYDPKPALTKVRCPVLAINGEKDLQVPAKQNLEAIASALKLSGNSHITTKELPGLNHLFQTCKTGAPSEYALIEETIAPPVLTLIGDWILAETGRK